MVEINILCFVFLGHDIRHTDSWQLTMATTPAPARSPQNTQTLQTPLQHWVLPTCKHARRLIDMIGTSRATQSEHRRATVHIEFLNRLRLSATGCNRACTHATPPYKPLWLIRLWLWPVRLWLISLRPDEAVQQCPAQVPQTNGSPRGDQADRMVRLKI